jgi:hypothetical protein
LAEGLSITNVAMLPSIETLIFSDGLMLIE